LGGGLILGGWTSNILDRLGLHNWTAPGSARGVVDFIPDGTPGRSNTADLFIAIGAVVLAVALLRRHGEQPPPPARRPSVRAWIAALIVIGAAIVLAVTSAIDHEGGHAPDQPLRAADGAATGRTGTASPGGASEPIRAIWS